MPNGPFAQLLEQIAASRRERGLPTPFADRRLGPAVAPAQPQRAAPAPVQPRTAQPAPAASAGPRRGYDPQVEALQERLAAQGINPGPIDGLMGPQTMAAMEQARRSEMASPMAAPMQRPGGMPTAQAAPFVPMQRPGSGAVPLPPPNPSRMLEGAPMLADAGNFMPAQAGNAPNIPVERGPLPPPGWRPASGTPQTYGPGMAVPRGTPGTVAGIPAMPPGFDALLSKLLPPSAMTMQGAQNQYNSLPTPQRRNIEVMNMQQLQQFISSGDPSGDELRRANTRLEQLRVEAIMQGQGVGNPLQGAPMLGPGV